MHSYYVGGAAINGIPATLSSAITFSQGNYMATENGNSTSGTYQQSGDTSITFTPNSNFIVPMTLNGSITFLNGTYHTDFKADSLFMSKQYNQYRLKKN